MRALHLIVIVIPLFSFSQNSSEYSFIGALTTADNIIISYKLSFEIADNGSIEGVSVTDFYGDNKTTSQVTGKFDEKRNLLAFKEISNIKTNSSETEDNFCFIGVSNLKLRKVKGKLIANGEFIGKYPSGEQCATGQIYLASANIIEDLRIGLDSMRNVGQDTISTIDSILNLAEKKETIYKSLKPNGKTNINWSGKVIAFDVWDRYEEDNDMINIYYNGKLIEENFKILNQKKHLELPFNGSKGLIRIVALNEGDSGKNTVNITFKGEHQTDSYISNLHKGEEVLIEFNRSR